MKKTIMFLLAACLVVVVGWAHSGRTDTGAAAEPAAEAKPKPDPGSRSDKYGRLAIVCAPGTGADAKYVSAVLRGAEEGGAKYLFYLPMVKIVPDAVVDTGTSPPKVKINNINDYDAIAVVTYNYNTPLVLVDITLIDAKTGQQLYAVQLHAKPDDIGDLAPKAWPSGAT